MDRVDLLPKGIVRNANEVCRRTMLSAAWNRREGQVFFYKHGDLSYGIFGCPVEVLRDGAGVETVCRTIYGMRRPWESKERDIACAKADMDASEQAELDNRMDAIENDARPYAKHVVNKMTMGKHSRPSALV